MSAQFVRPFLLILACLLIAFGLRVFRLDAQSLWYDEVETTRYALDLLKQDIHPPAYYVLIGLTLQLGRSEFILRFPSVLQDVLGIAVAFALTHRLFHVRTALLTALLMALSAILVWHAQDMRMYSQMIFTTLLVAYTYVIAIENNRRTAWIVFVSSAIVVLYTHLYGTLMLGVLGLHFLLFKRKPMQRWFIANLIIGLGYLPWLVILINMPSERIGTGRSNLLLSLPYTLMSFLSGYSLGPSVNEVRLNSVISVVMPYLGILLLLAGSAAILFITGAVSLFRQNASKLFLLLLWIVVPVVVAIAIPMIRSDLTYNVRYVLLSAPPLFMLIAYGSTRLRPALIGAGLFGVLLFCNGLSVYNLNTDSRYFKEDVRAAADFLETHIRPEDKVATITAGNIFKWYFDGDNEIVSNLRSDPPEKIAQEAAQLAPGQHLWLVIIRPWQTDEDGVMERLLLEQFSTGETASFPGVRITQLCRGPCS